MARGQYNPVQSDADVVLTTDVHDDDNVLDEGETNHVETSHGLNNNSEDDKRLVPTRYEAAEMTVDDAIERLGMGPFQLWVLVAAGMCFAADAMQVILLGFLCEVLKLEWNLTVDETAFITSILFVGAIFGTLILGPLADHKGRKVIFLLAGSIISVFGIAVACCTNYWSVLAMLFMIGVGVGGLTVPFDILAECIPSHSRGKNLLVIEYFWTVGVLFVVLVAHSTLGNGQTSGNWRLFVVICSMPCFVSVIIGVFFVPESPRWLCTVGRCDEALVILREAATKNGKDPDILFPEGTQILEEHEEEANFCELFSPKWRWTTLKLWGAWCAFAFGYYGTIMIITEIFAKEGPTTDDDNTSETYNFDYGAIFVSSSAELVGTSFAISSVDSVGRIPLQVVSYFMAGTCVFSLCFFASRDAHRDVLIALGFAARIFEMAGSCVSWVSTAEILTTDVRTTGHSAANAIARIGSLFAPFLVQSDSSLARKGFIMLTIHLITVSCVSQLPETKGSHMGTTREEEEDLDDLVLEEHEADEPLAAEDHVIT
eukprot:Nitzschia sp. Nitz4//scaffold57_size113557//13151//14779//NITZ4_003982-RA/size113557-processed-gene-0.151-mRNA-1//-1//CDS//3329554819//2890//frame0